MATPRKRWPNIQMANRDRAGEAVVRIIRNARKIKQNKHLTADDLSCLLEVLDAAHEAYEALRDAGAPVVLE